jgi:Flp pilus assembly protein TadG
MEDATATRREGTAERFCRAAGRRGRIDAGQALLEFALLLPFLSLLSVGVVELGRAAFITIVVTNAATAGVEYGAQNGTTASDTAGMQTAAANDASNNVIGGTMTATATYGCYCDTGTGTSCSYVAGGQNSSTCSNIVSSCSTGNDQIVECVQVVTQDNYMPLFHYPGLPTSYQANGRAVMRVRR